MGASSLDGASSFGCSSSSLYSHLKTGQVQGGWEIPLRAVKATAAMAEDDITTSTGILDTNSKAVKAVGMTKGVA